jgi:hypothetical protein
VTDILSVVLKDTSVDDSDEALPGVILDYDNSGNVVSLLCIACPWACLASTWLLSHGKLCRRPELRLSEKAFLPAFDKTTQGPILPVVRTKMKAC